MNDFESIWNNVLDTLQNNISEQGFNTWFKETSLVEQSENQLTVKVPTKFIADYLNKNYSGLVSEICFNLFNKKYFTKFTVFHSKITRKDDLTPSFSKVITNFQTMLNPKYSFEEFVIGANNKFAHSASMAVAESPGNTYNPLFIYGESGMGKTHLMQAIGNFVRQELENKNVFYISTEEFTNEMINAIRNNSMPAFRNKFRNFDVLLIDDIHFFIQKRGNSRRIFSYF